ncbi:small multi-drug export protein [Clostridium sp. Sa3CUN1]|uniref:Small multi-drug export protein n=1 Tax=Clostridium gallinarum TaxID=2762246 RepID=A0ABR8Q543_9CLOT|nr:small multi-drug export protein [Clostridium gallinarum]MBD7915542.1 small multi-drug export protein [Clostridium gallinarum]
MTDSLINWFTNTLSFMPKELIAFIISMMPILELRGGLVAASLLGIGVFNAIIICVIGNIIPIPFILFFITPIFNWMKNTKLFRPIVEKLESKSMAKSEQIQKYEFWGLALFVGIPLPGTGAWTGALIAALLGIKTKKASLAIFTGIIIATIIMTIISYGIPWVIQAIA